MISWVRSRIDTFLGQGDAAVTVPPMDGALSPNTRLDRAALVARMDSPDDIAQGDATYVSSGNTVYRLAPDGTPEPFHHFAETITCLAARGDRLAVGQADTIILLHEGCETIVSVPCPTALAFNGDTLIATQGSSRNAPHQWKHDLMQRGSTGAVWQIAPNAAPKPLATGLAWPNGIAITPIGIVISESWHHRLIRLGTAQPVLSDLPGYPARLAPARDGWWLALFAPRGQLVEFVLRERRYCTRMMAEIDPDNWLAPAIAPPKSFLEPMMGGALRSHGFAKPWAPSNSYGLLVCLDAHFRPIRSFHSRADGTRHGITAALDLGSHVLVASHGGNALLKLDPTAGDRP